MLLLVKSIRPLEVTTNGTNTEVNKLKVYWWGGTKHPPDWFPPISYLFPEMQSIRFFSSF